MVLLLTLAQMQMAAAVQSDGYIHKNHFYAVSFDGEGDAIVRSQIVIENTTESEIRNINFEIPGEIVVYQVVQENPGRATLDYDKIITSEATVLNIDLEYPIKTMGQGTLVLFYKIPHYAKQDLFGNFEFDFKTIIDKDAILIENIRVAVNVQEGLFLKGGEAKVDYRPGFGIVSETALSEIKADGISSPYYNDYYYGIRNAQGLVKNASNLDPLESFHVKGNFGENYAMLYLFDGVFWLIGIGLIIAGIVFALKKGAKELKINSGKENDFIKSGAIAFGSAIGIIVTIIGGFVLANIINGISYNLSGIGLLVMLLAGAISLGLLFFPALYVSSKKGILQGAVTFFLTIIFLIILGMIALIAYQMLFANEVYRAYDVYPTQTIYD